MGEHCLRRPQLPRDASPTLCGEPLSQTRPPRGSRLPSREQGLWTCVAACLRSGTPTPPPRAAQGAGCLLEELRLRVSVWGDTLHFISKSREALSERRVLILVHVPKICLCRLPWGPRDRSGDRGHLPRLSSEKEWAPEVLGPKGPWCMLGAITLLRRKEREGQRERERDGKREGEREETMDKADAVTW